MKIYIISSILAALALANEGVTTEPSAQAPQVAAAASHQPEAPPPALAPVAASPPPPSPLPGHLVPPSAAPPSVAPPPPSAPVAPVVDAYQKIAELEQEVKQLKEQVNKTAAETDTKLEPKSQEPSGPRSQWFELQKQINGSLEQLKKFVDQMFEAHQKQLQLQREIDPNARLPITPKPGNGKEKKGDRDDKDKKGLKQKEAKKGKMKEKDKSDKKDKKGSKDKKGKKDKKDKDKY